MRVPDSSWVPNLPLRRVTIPGYRLQRIIATGTFASVFLATGIADQRQIAVKVIRHDGGTEVKVLTRLMQEHHLQSRLESRHIVRVFERGLCEDYGFIAMEYCSHGDLWRQLRRRTLEPAQSIAILRQISLGLAAAHNRRVIHRDLKPANVLVRDANTVALGDFGAACSLEQAADRGRKRLIAGTPAYASPEIIKCEEVDGRADLYSAGVILYQMVTGALPYRGPSVDKMLEAHVHARLPRLRGALAMLQPVIEGLLAKDPDDRFQSAEELLAGLKWIAHQQGWPCPSSKAVIQ
jgi:serine/threonine-protein kinase PpkA